jgi:putative ABC transport system ATP-binding protein
VSAEGTHTPGHIIQLDGICKSYSSGDVVVNAVVDVSLRIAKGDLVAIMGASGSGKSSLLNLLGCLDQPSKGTYLLSGENVANLGHQALAQVRSKRLGFVFQSFNLLSRTSAVENVELPMLYAERMVSGAEQRRRAIASLTRVGLADRLEHFPNQLSGGQQQRVAIARALVNEPDVVLADEPTGNLDTRTSIEIMGLFQALNEAGITVVLVTHELDIAAFCNRVIVMRDGRIINDSRNAAPRSAKEALVELDDNEVKAKVAS